MPRIVIIPQVYPPEFHPTAVMFGELAEYLSCRGWDVTISAGWPHHPRGTVYPGWHKRLYARSKENGVEVVRTWHLTHAKRTIAARAAVLVSQALAAAIGAICSKRTDVVLVCGPPLIGPDLGALVAAWHGARFVNVIYDLYPDVAAETGKVRSRLVLRLAREAERVQYRASDMTLVLSEGFRRTMISRGIPPDRVETVPVWIDTDDVRPTSRLNSWRLEQNIPAEKFVVLYAGTIGFVSGAAVVIDAAKLLRTREDVLFLFVGEGEESANLRGASSMHGLTNVMFLPFQPRERLSEVQATADVGLVTLLPGKGRTSVPSKLLGYMSAARAVIASVDDSSDTAMDVQESGCGVVVPPGDARALADAVWRLAPDSAKRDSLGRAGREWLERNRSKTVVLDRYRMILEKLATRSA